MVLALGGGLVAHVGENLRGPFVVRVQFQHDLKALRGLLLYSVLVIVGEALHGFGVLMLALRAAR